MIEETETSQNEEQTYALRAINVPYAIQHKGEPPQTSTLTLDINTQFNGDIETFDQIKERLNQQDMQIVMGKLHLAIMDFAQKLGLVQQLVITADAQSPMLLNIESHFIVLPPKPSITQQQ